VCEICGVAEAQYRRAMSMLSMDGWARLYRRRGIDPGLMGIDELTEDQLAFVESSITSYLPVHRDAIMSLPYEDGYWDQLRRWRVEHPAQVAAVTRAGC
jgi:hypothetical protein